MSEPAEQYIVWYTANRPVLPRFHVFSVTFMVLIQEYINVTGGKIRVTQGVSW